MTYYKLYKYEDYIFKVDAKDNYLIESKTTPPRYLCKYFNTNNYNKEAFLEHHLYCSHPYQLNDSLDCSYHVWNFNAISETQFNKLIKDYTLHEYNMTFSEEQKCNFIDLRWILYNLTSNRLGIISLTVKCLDDLMWGHYSSESGFMIRFNKEDFFSEIEPLNPNYQSFSLFPLDYQEHLKKINCKELLNHSIVYPLLASATLKRKEWDYENEWRLMITSKDGFGVPNSEISNCLKDWSGNKRFLKYSPKSIEQIILGKYFFNGRNSIGNCKSDELRITSCQDILFINHIIENFNDRLFICDENDGEYFHRIAKRIELKKLDFNKFKIIYTGEYLSCEN